MIDYVVVGGGVYGCAVAWELSKRGCSVRLIEAGALAAGASGGPGRRGVRANGRDRRELPLMELAYDVWPGLHEALGSEQFYERTGHLMLLESSEQVQAAAAIAQMQSLLGIETRLVEREELHEMEPHLSPNIVGALHCPSDGVADHTATTLAYAAAAESLGAQLTERCAMQSLQLSGERVDSVTTDAGERISVGRGVILLSNGQVKAQLSATTGLDLPVWNVSPQILMTEPMAELPFSHLIGHASRTISLKTQGNDRVMISGGFMGEWDERTNASRVLPMSLTGNLAEAEAVIPSLADVGIEEANVSRRESRSPDDIPIIDSAPDVDNLWFATGWSGHGWAIAPVVASELARWCDSGQPSQLLEPFALRRFFGR